MKRGKFESQPVAKKNNGKKIVSLLLVLVLLLGAVVGTTMAWLSQKTETIKNTFTVGSIGITLEETYNTFKMTPGAEIDKDPVVTVEADSENCWLFVKIDETNNDADEITYEVVNTWTELTTVPGVYFQLVTSKNTAQEFHILEGDKVYANENLTKAYLDGVKADTSKAPTLSFTAYAIQSDDLSDSSAIPTTGDAVELNGYAARAWTLVSNP